MQEYKFIKSNNTNPYFNIASEEYLLKQTNGYYIYLWQNSPSVIIGNHQNTLLEVNLPYANENDIKVIRRLTGGGAVYHDLNNVCYTIIAPFSSQENNYVKFTKPVIDFLQSLNVNAEFSGRNDICIDGKKISGNAQVVYKDRILHHGTILFDTNLEVLDKVLMPNKLKTLSKGIKSNRARVVNIKDHLKNGLTCKQFFDMLSNHLSKTLSNYTFTNEDVAKINELVLDKYSTYEWNVGKSPIGSNRLDYRFTFGTATITFDLINGLMQNTQMYGDYFANTNVQDFIARLNGKPFAYKEVFQALDGIEKVINGASNTEIAEKLFN